MVVAVTVGAAAESSPPPDRRGAFVGVTGRRDRGRMIDVASRAAEQGFDLEVRSLRGQRVWAWHCGDDWRWPCFLTERQAWEWMEDRLSRVRVFTAR